MKKTCESVRMNVCAQRPGATFIESRCPSDKHTRADKYLQGGTRCHGKCRENNQLDSDVGEKEKKSAEKRIP